MLGLIAAAALAAPAVETRKGFPHRQWADVATFDLPVEFAQACFVSTLMAHGRVNAVPIDGGSDVYFALGGWTSAPPYIRFMLRPRNGQTEVTALYRRPMSQRAVSGFVVDLQERCSSGVLEQIEGGSR